MAMGFWANHNWYCEGCRHWRYFYGFYGCFKFRIYRLDEIERQCGGKYRE